MMAGRGKLRQTKKDKYPAREAIPLRAPFDEFKLSPSTSSRRRSEVDLLPGLPDKAPRTRTNKSPLTKAPPTKDGTIEVPGLGSLLEKSVDERHQSNHFGDPPLKKHQAPPTVENSDKSVESSTALTGAKGLFSTEKSIESSSIQAGDKGLNATDKSIESSHSQAGDKDPNETDTIFKSIESSSSQEGNKSPSKQITEATEVWLAGITIFDERKIGTPKWGDLPEDDDEGIQGSKVGVNGQVEGNTNEKRDDKKEIETNTPPLESSTSTDFNPNDPRLYN
jgi:hypothetical protein